MRDSLYKDNWKNLKENLKILHLLLHKKYLNFKNYSLSDHDSFFRGLFITDEEVEDLLSLSQLDFNSKDDEKSVNEVRKIYETIKNDIEKNESNITSTLSLISKKFGLDSLARVILLIALAPDIDLRYEKIYAYLQDDVTKKRPTVQFTIDLLSPLVEPYIVLKEYFHRDSLLISNKIISLKDDPSFPIHSELGKFLIIPDRIRRFLLFMDERQDEEINNIKVLKFTEDISLLLPEEIKEMVQKFSEDSLEKERPLFLLGGKEDWFQKEFAIYMASTIGLKVLSVSISEANKDNNDFWVDVIREGILQSAALYLEIDYSFKEETLYYLYRDVLKKIDSYPFIVFFRIKRWLPRLFQENSRLIVPIPFSRPDYNSEKRSWHFLLSREFPKLLDQVPWLAAKFRYSPLQIKGAIKAMKGLSLVSGDHKGQSSLHDLLMACRWQSDHSLGELARKISPHYSWDDLILPPDRKLLLKEICNVYRYRPIVYGEWRFEEYLSSGKGLVVLFCGASGTGKTMAAEIIAKSLDLELYKINLSAIISKYVGETEKNLERIFGEAEKTDALLFFDEAEAIFGKRSEVKDAHDRYANIEVSYLLQRIEEYEGMIILASNLKKNIDDAFIRRMNYVVDFPFPGEEDRLRLWQGVFPKDVPVDPSIDMEFMARRFKLSGGNIRNIALRASFLAAQDGGKVNMSHLLWATRREFQNMGKLIVEEDFYISPDKFQNEKARLGE